MSGAIAQFVPNTSVGLIAPNITGYLIAYLEFCVPYTILISAVSLLAGHAHGQHEARLRGRHDVPDAYMVILNAIESVERRWLASLDLSGILWLIEVVGKGKTNTEQNAIGWMMDGPFLVNRSWCWGWPRRS